LAFEYANPSDPSYYEPDPANPAFFHLHKKDTHADHLLHWKTNFPLGTDEIAVMDIKTGYSRISSTSSLSVEVLENDTPQSWAIRVSVANGGLQSEAEQFPFVAPTSGYQPSIVLNSNTPPPPTWNGDTFFRGGGIFVQTPEGYGRYEVRMMLRKRYVEIEGYFNPNPGSRNLEPASK
jgi:hypothetical protein